MMRRYLVTRLNTTQPIFSLNPPCILPIHPENSQPLKFRNILARPYLNTTNSSIRCTSHPSLPQTLRPPIPPRFSASQPSPTPGHFQYTASSNRIAASISGQTRTPIRYFAIQSAQHNHTVSASYPRKDKIISQQVH